MRTLESPQIESRAQSAYSWKSYSKPIAFKLYKQAVRHCEDVETNRQKKYIAIVNSVKLELILIIENHTLKTCYSQTTRR